MEPKRDLAIVLRAIPYEDRHRIVTALTENHGVITAMARNAVQSRRFGGALEPFSAAEWLFTEKPGAEICTVNEAHIRRAFEGLRKDFEKLSLAAVFNELMMKVAPQRESCGELFRLHSNALAYLEESGKPGADLALLNAYLAKILQWNGHQPQLAGCLGCGSELEKFISSMPEEECLGCLPADAAWICPTCRAGQTHHVRGNFDGAFLRVSPLAIHDFRWAMALPIRKGASVALASKAEHQSLFRYLEALFAFHMPGFDQKPLKGLRFLDVESSLQSLPGRPRQSPLPLI